MAHHGSEWLRMAQNGLLWLLLLLYAGHNLHLQHRLCDQGRLLQWPGNRQNYVEFTVGVFLQAVLKPPLDEQQHDENNSARTATHALTQSSWVDMPAAYPLL
jgi:hypothetical protein